MRVMGEITRRWWISRRDVENGAPEQHYPLPLSYQTDDLKSSYITVLAWPRFRSFAGSMRDGCSPRATLIRAARRGADFNVTQACASRSVHLSSAGERGQVRVRTEPGRRYLLLASSICTTGDTSCYFRRLALGMTRPARANARA